MSIVVTIPKLFTNPLGMYACGTIFAIYINGHYKCKKEVDAQKRAGMPHYCMGKIIEETFFGLMQGVFVGIFWPVMAPTFVMNYFNGEKKEEESK